LNTSPADLILADLILAALTLAGDLTQLEVLIKAVASVAPENLVLDKVAQKSDLPVRSLELPHSNPALLHSPHAENLLHQPNLAVSQLTSPLASLLASQLDSLLASQLAFLLASQLASQPNLAPSQLAFQLNPAPSQLASQLNPAPSQLDPALSQLDPALSQLDPALSQPSPALSQPNPALYQLNLSRVPQAHDPAVSVNLVAPENLGHTTVDSVAQESPVPGKVTREPVLPNHSLELPHSNPALLHSPHA
jgi:hypothetical protein